MGDLFSDKILRSVVGILEMNLAEVEVANFYAISFGFILVFLASNQQLAKTHFNKI